MEICEAAHFARGFCQRHYAQLQRGIINTSGELLRPLKRTERRFADSPVCSFPECNGPVRTCGWCNKHYLQFRSGIIDAGNNVLREKKSNPGRGWKTYMRGYVKVMCKGHPDADRDGYVLEHRLVMEKVLGRRLTKDEIVHHKDGVRHNNTAENLEVCTRKKHPPAHEYTKPVLKDALLALRHNDPEAFADLVREVQ